MSAISKAMARSSGRLQLRANSNKARESVAVNDTSRWRPAQDLQRHPAATAPDVGDPTGRVEIQRTDQRFIDRA
jgi:hypothetical protein